MTALQAEIEARLAEARAARSRCCSPRCSAATRVRLFIDHPDGVTLALCERVTHLLAAAPRALRARGLLARAASAR